MIKHSFCETLLVLSVVAILRTLNIPVHFVGWSYGGGMLLRAAIEVPDLVRTVTVYEPSLSSILPDTPRNKALLEAFGQGFAAAFAAAKTGDGVSAMPMAVEFVLGMQKGGFATLTPRIQAMLVENAQTMMPDFDAHTPEPLTCAQIGEASVMGVRGKPGLSLCGGPRLRGPERPGAKCSTGPEAREHRQERPDRRP